MVKNDKIVAITELIMKYKGVQMPNKHSVSTFNFTFACAPTLNINIMGGHPNIDFQYLLQH